jgi:hypothetical protein
MQITTMEKNERGTHQKITDSFSTGTPYLPPPAHDAYILPTNKDVFWLSKNKIWFGLAIISYIARFDFPKTPFPNQYAIWLSKNTNHDLS